MSDPTLNYANLFPSSQSVRITRFDVTGRASLAAIPTVSLNVGTVLDVVTGSGSSSTLSSVQLQNGAANITDVTQVQAADNLSVHWQVIAGFIAS